MLVDYPRTLAAATVVAVGGQDRRIVQSTSSRGQAMKTFFTFGVLLLLTSGSYAEPLKAGAARIDITPPVGYPMWGYAARRDAPSLKVRDSLQARAVVLTGSRQFCAHGGTA